MFKTQSQFAISVESTLELNQFSGFQIETQVELRLFKIKAGTQVVLNFHCSGL